MSVYIANQHFVAFEPTQAISFVGPEDPRIVRLASGGFIAAWEKFGGFYAQIFDRHGVPSGSVFPLHSPSNSSTKDSLAIAPLPGGGFAATWQSSGSQGLGIEIRLYDASGAPLGPETFLNGVSDVQPRMAALAGGGVVVTYSGDIPGGGSGLIAQRLDSSGAKSGSEIVVQAATVFGPPPQYSFVSGLADGGFVVAWIESSLVRAQIFDSSSQKVGGVLDLAPHGSWFPTLATLADGNFILAYVVGNDLKAKIFSPAGAVVVAEFDVATSLSGTQYLPSIVPLETGEFMITWRDATLASPFYEDGEIRGQLFSAGGARIGDEFLVNTVTTGGQGEPASTVFGSGDVATVWLDFSGGTQGEAKIRLFFSTQLGSAGADVIVGSPDRDFVLGFAGNDNVTTGAADDELDGGDGDDVLSGGAGADRIDGGAGNDVLISFDASNVVDFYEQMVSLDTGTEHDVLIGGDGDDKLAAGYGDDVSGGAGNNRLSINFLGATSGVVADFRAQQSGGSITVGGGVISGITHTANIQGSDYNDVIHALGSSFGHSRLYGNGGDDQLAGSASEFYGGAGNDIIDGRSSPYLSLVDGGDGDDLLYTSALSSAGANGGDGNDTIYAHGLTYGGAGNDTIVMQSADYAGSIYGEAGDDDITGNGAGMRIAGGSGADVIRGGAGNDTLASADFQPTSFIPAFDMGLEHDVLTGGGGDDILSIGYGDDVDGGSGNDTLRLSLGGLTAGATLDTAGIVSGQPFVLGGGTIQNIESLAFLRGSDHADVLTIATQATYLQIEAGDGDDRITTDGSAVNLQGGNGDDHFYSGAGADTFNGGAGFDTVYYHSAAAGVTVTLGPPGFAGSGAGDTLFNVEAVEGSDHADHLTGNAFADRLTGRGGDDSLAGLAGNDTLLAGAGSDRLDGGEGNDVLYFGGELSSGDVADGGAGRDAIVLQGNVVAVLNDANLVGIESISIQSGANAKFGDTANNFYDFDIATADGNVAAGQQMIVNASSLRAGEDLIFDGSAESDGRFLVYGGHGVDDLTGGAGNDIFFFEGQRWGAGDKVDGGAGRDALVISAGSGLTHIEFAADALTGIESISVNNRYATDPSQKPSYELVLNNGNVAPGATLIVNGSSIPLGQVVNIDGRAVQDGNLILFGGGGHDVLIGGAGADLIIGGGGQDSLTGGAGADTFRYDAVSNSPAGATDLIADFQTGLDKIDLSRIDANTLVDGDQAFSWIGSSAFGGAAGELRVRDEGGYRYVEGDTNGDGNADFAIAFYAVAAPQIQGDFIL